MIHSIHSFLNFSGKIKFSPLFIGFSFLFLLFPLLFIGCANSSVMKASVSVDQSNILGYWVNQVSLIQGGDTQQLLTFSGTTGNAFFNASYTKACPLGVSCTGGEKTDIYQVHLQGNQLTFFPQGAAAQTSVYRFAWEPNTQHMGFTLTHISGAKVFPEQVSAYAKRGYVQGIPITGNWFLDSKKDNWMSIQIVPGQYPFQVIQKENTSGPYQGEREYKLTSANGQLTFQLVSYTGYLPSSVVIGTRSVYALTWNNGPQGGFQLTLVLGPPILTESMLSQWTH